MNFINVALVIPKIRKGLMYSFMSGFCVGCVPNKLYINFEDKKINLPIPILSGLICSIGCLMSPLLLINYCSKNTYFLSSQNCLINIILM